MMGVDAMLSAVGAELVIRHIENVSNLATKSYYGNYEHAWSASDPKAVVRSIADALKKSEVTASYGKKYENVDEPGWKDDALRVLGIGKEKSEYKAYRKALDEASLEDANLLMRLKNKFNQSTSYRFQPVQD